MKNIKKKKIRELLREEGISIRKEMGQSFLTNWKLIEKEAEYSHISGDDVVLEIGGGIGNLTEVLADRAKKVVCIEKDEQYKRRLLEVKDEYGNVEVIIGDALEVDFPSFDKTVSNLPFKIALPLIFKLVNNYDFKTGLLLVQESLAKRMTAKPGQKGFSRLYVQIYRNADVELHKKIPKSAFHPSPNVDSAFVRVQKTSPKFRIPSEDFFKEVLKYLFSQRDKSVEEAVKELRETEGNTSYVGEVLESLNESLDKSILSKKIRTVSPEQFGSIARVFWDKKRGVGEKFKEYYKKKGLYQMKR